MNPHPPTAHDIPHSPPLDGRFAGGPIERDAVIQARLNEISRRDPRAVLGVLDFWLWPKPSDDGDARDG